MEAEAVQLKVAKWRDRLKITAWKSAALKPS
jgi:hypothetical protein